MFGGKIVIFKFPLVSLTDSKQKWKSKTKYNFRWIPTKKKELCIFEKIEKNKWTMDIFPTKKKTCQVVKGQRYCGKFSDEIIKTKLKVINTFTLI